MNKQEISENLEKLKDEHFKLAMRLITKEDDISDGIDKSEEIE